MKVVMAGTPACRPGCLASKPGLIAEGRTPLHDAEQAPGAYSTFNTVEESLPL
jgi:hypothetical protein